ncbi:hypothetical protein HH303_15490 [Rhodospirillaceae bacterium KN72]|uniref:Uncharacterized protein n=1 Tax=Pacificispira spongiicola TaxID=2729598 RepID=A0A7Y0E298_9PROT|nr:hypothetical protein [Pacificispira spongiicola]NMM45900.1 hypothetical protein [Pacificispira spongiicola]
MQTTSHLEIRDARDPVAVSAVIALLCITATMLLFLVTQTDPHPPNSIALFALGPFFSASLAIGFVAWFLSNEGHRAGNLCAVGFALTGLLSFGPHKYFDPSFPSIWPAVVAAQISIVVIAVRCTRLRRRQAEHS